MSKLDTSNKGTELSGGVVRRRFRADIEGLRAIAVISVVVYHLHAAWLPGGFVGVDIFFVISGFLITSHLIRELEKTGRISLTKFYARRMIRLIPAATLVLFATVVAAFLFAPQITWRQIGIDVVGAAFYVVNWVFASRSIDYLAEDSVDSPVQHFWSLSVEEQYYFIWPLIIIVAALVAARRRVNLRTAVAIGGGVVIVTSILWAVWMTINDDVTAYFSTPARLWELAIGAVLAAIYPAVERAGRVVRRVGYYCGLVMLGVSLIVITGEMNWPGIATALPTLGSALLIAFGGVQSTWGERVVSTKPMVWVGGISYSMYLWHWPILIFAGYVWPNPSIKVLVACFVASLVFAWLSKVLVEDPVRRAAWSRRRARNGLFLGVSLAVVSALGAGGLAAVADSNSMQAPADAVAEGAKVLGTDPSEVMTDLLISEPEWVLPNPVEATNDVPQLYEDGCQQDQVSAEVLVCEYGQVDAPDEIIIVGDSKVNQWLPAFDKIGVENNLRITVMTKSACSFTNAPARISGAAYESCDEWNRNADDIIEERAPLALVTSMASSEASVPGGEQARRDALQEGLADKLKRTTDWTNHVIVLKDNPHPQDPVYECVLEAESGVAECAFDRSGATSASSGPIQEGAIAEVDGTILRAGSPEARGTNPSASRVTMLDMTDYICPPQLDVCPAVIGNALVYRQGSHLTATYVETLTESLGPPILHLIGR